MRGDGLAQEWERGGRTRSRNGRGSRSSRHWPPASASAAATAAATVAAAATASATGPTSVRPSVHAVRRPRVVERSRASLFAVVPPGNVGVSGVCAGAGRWHGAGSGAEVEARAGVDGAGPLRL